MVQQLKGEEIAPRSSSVAGGRVIPRLKHQRIGVNEARRELLRCDKHVTREWALHQNMCHMFRCTGSGKAVEQVSSVDVDPRGSFKVTLRSIIARIDRQRRLLNSSQHKVR
jgi:hypothetical protein